MSGDNRYLPIGDYALIGDGQSVALVSSAGSIDWCCLPRLDHGASFARLLDWDSGGFCSIHPADAGEASRRYVDDTLVLETTFRSGSGQARLLDCLTVNVDDPSAPYAQILRVVEGVTGRVDLCATIVARFDYGAVRPWRRYHGRRTFSLTGGDDALLVCGDINFQHAGRHDLQASFPVHPGDRLRLSLTFTAPHVIDLDPPAPLGPAELDRRLEATEQWWRIWSSQVELDGPSEPAVVRSAIVLKALANPTTGAIAAAATTSLPESPGGELNWDYRFSWVRDSVLSVRSLVDVGCADEADAFRRFIERSAAGAVEDLQIMYGVGGERRLDELLLEHLDGYRGARPVRVGNAAWRQEQLDVYGELVELAWRWHEGGNSLDDDYWRFVLELVDAAAARWRDPDRGIWEIRGEPVHFVHSKVMCWAALDRGIRLAEESLRQAPLERWRRERDAVRAAVEARGYDAERGIFVQAFDSDALDAAVLLLPAFGFVDWDDDRMVRTADAIREELDDGGLILRYRVPRGRRGREGTFVACSFWLVECLARQRRIDEAHELFDRAVATGNDLGLFAEEYDTRSGELLGNFPQGLSHLAHLGAALALAAASRSSAAPAEAPAGSR
jgi:GH15 family glucan-1,4-alpha-glucosidase